MTVVEPYHDAVIHTLQLLMRHPHCLEYPDQVPLLVETLADLDSVLLPQVLRRG